jgi:PAS domain-containing protein
VASRRHRRIVTLIHRYGREYKSQRPRRNRWSHRSLVDQVSETRWVSQTGGCRLGHRVTVRRRTREVGWEEVTPDDMAGSPWTELLAGAAVVHQQALSKLRVPALIMDLPDRRIRAANQALADLYAVPVPEIVGRVNSEVVEFDDVEAMKRALDAVSSGAIDGYRARRRITPRGGVARDVVVWCRAPLFSSSSRSPTAGKPMLSSRRR